MALSYQVASQRAIMNMKFQVSPRYGAPELDGAEEINIFSCRGEMAVAKYLNLFWSGSVGDYKAPDVGGLVEVRTINKAGRRLIVHPEDRDWAPYVLVDVSNQPMMKLVGWMFGTDAKNKKYWADPTGKGRHAYFVPQSDLLPMEQLKMQLSSICQK